MIVSHVCKQTIVIGNWALEPTGHFVQICCLVAYYVYLFVEVQSMCEVDHDNDCKNVHMESIV